MRFEVNGGSPVTVPPGSDQHRLTPDVLSFEMKYVGTELLLERSMDHNPVQASKRFQRQPREIRTIGVAMKRAVQVSSSVANHLYRLDAELRAWLVQRPGIFPTQVVAHKGRGQPLIRRHSRFNRVTQVNEDLSGSRHAGDVIRVFHRSVTARRGTGMR